MFWMAQRCCPVWPSSPFPLPEPHVPNVSPLYSKAQRSVKVLLKSKRNDNHSEKFWVEHRFFGGCCILQSPGVIYF